MQKCRSDCETGTRGVLWYQQSVRCGEMNNMTSCEISQSRIDMMCAKSWGNPDGKIRDLEFQFQGLRKQGIDKRSGPWYLSIHSRFNVNIVGHMALNRLL